MDTSTILSFIEEIKTDPKKFVETRVADAVSRNQLGSIIKDMELTLGRDSAFLVLNLHSENSDRVLSESFARRLLAQEKFVLIIQNCSVLMDEKSQDAQSNILRQLLALDDEKLENVVAAVQKASGAPVSKKRVTMATRIKGLLSQHSVLTVESVLAAFNLRGNKENTERVKKALEKLANDGVLCYDNSTPNRYLNYVEATEPKNKKVT